jgi:RNA polymerase sigma factor (TIGR02999 family)
LQKPEPEGMVEVDPHPQKHDARNRPMQDADPITSLLAAARQGEAGALDRLFELVYADLKRRAHLQRAGSTPTLSTTALVHEAYVKLASSSRADWADRAHFMRVAARAMRQILIDRARRQLAAKRGRGARPVTLEEVAVAMESPDSAAETLMALDDALLRLARQSERLAQVVELRFFGGLSVEDTATTLGVSDRTIKRDWRLARAFLEEALAAEAPMGESDS